MQNGKDSKVISLFGGRKAQNQTTLDKTASKPSLPNHQLNKQTKNELSMSEPSAESFLDIIRKNTENAERMRTERLKANKSVLRTYNIKD